MGYVFESGKRIEQEPTRRALWDAFGYACLPNKTLRLPSWCPDLQMQRGPSTPMCFSILIRRRSAAENTDSIMGFNFHGYVYEADDREIGIRIGESEKVLVLSGTVFDRLEEAFAAFPELDLPMRLSRRGDLERIIHMHASIEKWENRIATMVLGSQEIGTRYRGVMSLHTYWRTLVGNQTGFSAGDPVFTYETLRALRNFMPGFRG